MISLSVSLGNKEYKIETGKIAKLASAATIVSCGETMVLVTVCLGQDRPGDFLPLTIDYIEKTYAAGKIPGGFFKREGKLSERETLISRLIDRPCRPLFPKNLTSEVQVVATVISADEENDPDVLSLLGASAALSISEIPFSGPLAAVRVGRINGEFVINVSYEKFEKSDINLFVAGTKDAIMMVEGGAHEVPESDIEAALAFAHEQIQPFITLQEELISKCGKEKLVLTDSFNNAEIAALFTKSRGGIAAAHSIPEKLARRQAVSKCHLELIESFNLIKEKLISSEQVKAESYFNTLWEETVSDVVRERVFIDNTRIDGRDTKTVRPIDVELGLLPRAHGSALFTRGETQALVVATLGTEHEAQKLDNLAGESSKTFLLHYNFPPYSVGEVRAMRGPGRREIGHGALAERALKAVIPPIGKFPYVVRLVSEITESNGSSSMASVCGGSLALMEAGVPITSPVAGVAMGLLKREGKDNEFAILTDILGDEDHLGDMDFKVCGTANGITALQMDIKIKGITADVMHQALIQAKEARLHILEIMNDSLAVPKSGLSRYAPRIVSMKINPERIRDIIGPGGKTIRSISESCKVKIDISDDGTVSIISHDEKAAQSAVQVIEGLTEEVIVGKLYEGVVKRIVEFGAFVEVIPGSDGLVHISQLAEGRVNRVEDVVREGDIVWVKVLGIDNSGKIRLSIKEAQADREGVKNTA
jgi:polyribonucleotide nucleotidyltransferase